MKSHQLKIASIFTILVFALAGCQSMLPQSVNEEVVPEGTEDTASTASIEAFAEAADAIDPSPTQSQATPTPKPTEEPTVPTEISETQEGTSEAKDEDQSPSISEGLEDVGPENFPEDINPLTGLVAEKPQLLALPPALISISNFPASARPQAGLNSSPITFEIAIGEGMTRFLAMFYGEFPRDVSGQTEGGPTGGQQGSDSSENNSEEGTTTSQDDATKSASIGPIRSGRLPYEEVRSLYTGFLVMASAWEGVATNLSETTSVYGDNSEDINSALVSVDKLQEIAQAQAEGYPGSNFNLTGLKFSQSPPEGGLPAQQLWVFYSMLNQIQWQYNVDLGAYIRYDITTDGSDEFVMATDRLTGEPVSKENIVVIYAEHDYKAPTLIDINLVNRPPTKALLLRDGEIHEIFWTTRFGDYEKETGLMRPMRFVDAEGNPIAMKHGQTWVHIISTSSYHRESARSDHPFHPVIEQPRSGLWLVRYKGRY
jgi:hypothetical protein